MKREEKNLQSRRKILDSALLEFGERGYGLSSINTICTAGNISKGVMYHYFKDKDEVYLLCVSKCFEELLACLRERLDSERETARNRLETYFAVRMEFFEEHPLYQRIFSDAVMYPPAHLAAAIREIRRDFDAYNRKTLDSLLDQVTLRPDVSREEVMEIFEQFQNYIDAGCRTQSGAGIMDREKKCRRALSILLYGAVKRREGNDDERE